MRLLYKTSKFAIYDDVLDAQQFVNMWAYIQEEHYQVPTNNGFWLKVWRCHDGSPMGSRPYYASEAPFSLPLDVLNEKTLEAANSHPEIVKEFKEITYRSYLYPRGTKLSWHDDSTKYCGAMTYYAHPKWGSTWGGELFVAEVPPMQQVFEGKYINKPHLSHEWEDEYINMFGMGHFITPKPNRLVIMAPGTYHSISRVDADAGDHARCSVVGFYLPKTKKEEEEEMKKASS